MLGMLLTVKAWFRDAIDKVGGRRMRTYKVIGKAIPDIEITKKTTGATIYADDIKLPGLLYGKLLRSPYPHARILNIDISKAKQLAGVKAVITGRDVPSRRWGAMIKDKLPFAVDKVRCIGEEIAGIVAVDIDIAEEACDLIEVEYEALPAVFDPVEAMKEGAPLLHEKLEEYERVPVARPVPNTNISSRYKLVKGDVEEGFKQADYVFEDEFEIPSIHTAPLETMACLAQADALGNVTVWSSTQSPYEVRDTIAECLGIPLNKVRVIVPFLGGGFGGKFHIKGELACAFMAQFTGKPVKLVFSRKEVFNAGGIRHPLTIRIKSGVNKDGTIIARHCSEIWNTGAYADAGPRVMMRAMQSGGGPYNISNLRVDACDVYTNNPVAVAYRGFGANQPTWAIEVHMDIIAGKLDIDPLEFRMKNAIEEGEICPTGQVAHAVGLKECLRTLEHKGNWSKLRQAKKSYRGVGIACFNKATNTPTSGSVFVKLNQDGSADVMVSLVDMGQGTGTVLAQIVAEELTIPLEMIRISMPDTEATPYYTGTTGSRAAFVLGNAVKMAAEAARKELFALVSQLWEVEVEKLELNDGMVSVKGSSEKATPLSALPIGGGKFVSGLGYPIVSAGFYSSGDKATVHNSETMQSSRSSLFWMYGAHLAEVEVDAETGKVKVVRVLAVHNVGKALNPLLLEGQIDGGVSMAVGEALYEQLIRKDGKILNDSFLDYKLVTFGEAPAKIEHVFVEVPHRDSAYGSIGFGEAAMLGVSAAIANAIYDAVGTRIKELPITSEKVSMALREKKEVSASKSRYNHAKMPDK